MTDTVPHFPSWQQVPRERYLTRAQLRALDPPRRPGRPAATVAGRDAAGRGAKVRLYAVEECVPEPADAAGPPAGGARRCALCGARPELPCAAGPLGALCEACERIETLRQARRQAATARQKAVDEAVGLLLDDDLAVAHIAFDDRGRTASGGRRPPASARVTVLDGGGGTLADLTVRLVGARAKGVPPRALAPEAAAERLREALDGRVSLWWDPASAAPLERALRRADTPSPLPAERHDLRALATAWRGDLDPATGSPRPALAPGRADLMLDLLRRIAADDSRLPDVP